MLNQGGEKMPFLLALGFFGFVFSLMITLFLKIFSKDIAVQKRLNKIKEINLNPLINVDDLSKPLGERLIRPFIRILADLAGNFLPQEKKARWHKSLVLAGNPWNLSPNELFVLRQVMIVSLPVIFFILLTQSNMPLFQKNIFYVVAACIGYILPEQFLKSKWNNRRRAVIKNLPDTLDLLTVSVEAGLSFDGALVKVVEKSDHVLANEFKKVISETQMGKSRREALRDMSERLNVEELSAFINSLIQADTLGVSISKVLRIQSQQMRQKKRQMVEEKAMKAPVKMLIPMVLFIFPTIFIVLLGPAAIQIYEVFSK